jgi:hypothetical protein
MEPYVTTSEELQPVGPLRPIATQVPAIHLLTSRFNNDTWTENETYRARRNIEGCVYGAPLQVSHKIPLASNAYVIEMNNETNRIEGIGYIRVYPSFSERKNVYDNKNYNRYVYSGRYRLDREMLVRRNEDLVTAIETLLFKGKTHMKRGSGLTSMPKKLLKDKRCPPTVNIRRDIQSIFRTQFQTQTHSPDTTDTSMSM